MSDGDWNMRARKLARNAGAYARDLTTPTLRLGVTGFARSGKTVFITALIHNLLHGGQLSHFRAMRAGLIRGVRLEPHPDHRVARFDYEAHLEALLAEPPRWPESTRNISQLRLVIDHDGSGIIGSLFGSSSLNIDIVDYPGEWLLDLALLDQDFPTWSAQALRLAGEPARASLARPFLDHIGTIDPAAPLDERRVREGHRLYADFLKEARKSSHSLSLLTPGRFLLPGDLDGTPMLTFHPLPAPAGDQPPQAGLWRELAARYESFRSHVVGAFFTDHFAVLDRQIVLVDTLSALNAGAAALDDQRQALDAVLAAFRAGRNSWWSAILARKIERVLFAASKADHLHSSSHPQLEKILAHQVAEAMARGAAAEAQVKTLAIAALRSTEDVRARDGSGHLVAGVPIAGQSIAGQLTDGRTMLAIYPGDLPAEPAEALALASGPGGGLGLEFIAFDRPSWTVMPVARQSDGRTSASTAPSSSCWETA